MAMLCVDGVVGKGPECLRNVAFLKEMLVGLVKRVGMKQVGEIVVQPYAHWEGTAPSAVLFLEDSGIIVHWYPEKDYVELTLHTCSPITDPESIVQAIIEELALDVRYLLLSESRNWRERAAAKDRSVNLDGGGHFPTKEG